MTAAHRLRLLTVAAATAAIAGAGEHHKSCVSAGSATCKSFTADAPPVGNAQIQSTALLQRGPENPRAGSAIAALAVNVVAAGDSANLASISRRSSSQQMRLQNAAETADHGVARMRATWDGSMDEINGMIQSIVDHDSASEDSCSTQLLEYKKKLTTIHESTVSISVAVKSTSSEVSIFEKECKEKDEELEEIELVHQKRVTKCTTERSVQKKTLETLVYDMKEMKQVSRAHIHLKTNMERPRPYLIQEEAAHNPAPHQSLADVQGMVKQTKETASKVQTCLAKAHSARVVASGGNVSLAEESSKKLDAGIPWTKPDVMCDGAQPRCYPVTCTSSGWTCGDVSSCPFNQPRCHPVSCVGGRWQCGSVSDPSFEACNGKNRGDMCQFTMVNTAGKTAGSCVVHPVAPHRLDLLGEDVSEMANHKENAKDEPSADDDHVNDDDDDDGEDDEGNADGVEVFLQEDRESASKTSPLVGHAELKCVPAGTPTECQEVVVELEHQFTQSYVSLTRMIEEYEVVTHSTVCEETVEEEYTEESSGIQDDANKVCSQVQTNLAKLEMFKFEYQSTSKTEHKLESSIKLLVKQCGSLSSTEEYLTTVTTTLNALGDCPGLGEVQFQLPTWTGQWVKFNQKRDESNEWNDKEMLRLCLGKFGPGARVAEVSEIVGRSIEGMPDQNTADFAVLGGCPNCNGMSMPGLAKNGRGRICWDSGASFGRKDRRRDCGGGPRSILCVYD